jgi:hypothetical protein
MRSSCSASQEASGTSSRTASPTSVSSATPCDGSASEVLPSTRSSSRDAEGRSNQGIAERLCLAPKTVETHIHRIFTKLGLSHNDTRHRRVLAVLTYLNESANGG